MALLNTGCLVSTIQADVTGLTTGSPVECFVILAAGLDSAISDRCVTVPTSGSLPSLYPAQTVPQGQVMFVEDVGVPVIAASGKWIGFDQRVFRRDAPIPLPGSVGTLYAWGWNQAGRLGDGTTTSRSSPVTPAGGGSTWCAVSANDHTSAIKTDGTLWTWGYALYGRLGDGTTTSRSSPGTVAGGGTTWTQVSSGGSMTLAIKCDGSLWTWGFNNRGQLGNGTTTDRSSPGTMAGGHLTWCNISAGSIHSAAIKTDGTLWTWGSNGYGRLGDGNLTTTSRCSPGTVAGGGTNWKKVSSSFFNSAAIKNDGTLWTWGQNNVGQLGDGTTTERCSPVTTAGGGTTWCDIAVGVYHMVAIKTDGTLWSWGCNSVGRLGDNSTTNRCSPGTTAGAGTSWYKTSAGYHSAALKIDGSLWTWGCNFYGQLGDGTATTRSSPVSVSAAGFTWGVLSVGSNYTTAIKV